MPTVPGVDRFTIYQSLDTPADGWEAESSDTTLMTAPDDTALHSLPVGLLNDLDQEVTVTQVVGGVIVARRLVDRGQGQRVILRGLDAMHTALETQRRIRYKPTGGPEVLASTITALQERQATLDALYADLQNRSGYPSFPDDAARAAELDAVVRLMERHALRVAQEQALADLTTEKVGKWTAKSIAADLLAGTGLTLLWGVRDYALVEPFEAMGSVYEALRQLVAPWDQPAPFGVDITVVGTELYVMPRVPTPPATTDTFTMAEARFDDVTVGDRQRLPRYGLVEIEGRMELAQGGFEFHPGDPPIPETPTGTAVTITGTIVVTDPRTGVTVSAVEKASTYRMPDRLLTGSVDRLYQRNMQSGSLVPVQEEIADTTYEDSQYGPGGPVNQPLPLAASRRLRTIQSTGALEETRREETIWTYDRLRFLVAKATMVATRQQATTTSSTGVTTPVVDSSGAAVLVFKAAEWIIETYTDRLDGWVEVVVSRVTLDAQGVPSASATLSHQDAAGFRPGGIRPPFAFEHAMIIDHGGQGELRPIRHAVLIDSDPAAIPMRYSNRNLTPEDCEFLLTLYANASGLWELPLRASGPAMPWLRKGAVLQLTEYFAPDGTTEHVIPAAQVRAVTLRYEDSERRSEFRGDLEAVAYVSP